MAENSKIEWTHHTFNPWRGCTKVSAGCAHCYAETLSGRNPKTLGVWGPNGTRVVAAEAQWREPLKWDKAAEKAGERHRVFCASLADVFEQWTGPMVNAKGERLKVDTRGRAIKDGGLIPGDRDMTMDDVRERLLFLIRDTPNLDWLLLTKRPEHILGTFGRLDAHDVAEQLPNLWLGTSVENQAAADARIPHLLAAPAAVLFLSCEPLLGPVQLGEHALHGGPGSVDWVIVGGESGNGARPFDLAWARSLVEQCKAAGAACFVKQLGERPVSTGNQWGSRSLPLLAQSGYWVLNDRKGGDPAEWPDHLRVRQFPKAAA